MSVAMTTLVWKHSKAESSQLLILLAIADISDDEGYAEEKIGKLAAKCRQSPRATSRQIASLQTAGELKVRIGKGRGNRNGYQITIKENMPKWHGLEDVKHAISGQENMPSGARIYSRHVNNMNKTTMRARARHVSGENLPLFPLPTLAQFTEEFFDEKLTDWIETNSPAIAPMRATEAFLDYHAAEQTEFKSKSHLLNLWKGWMRNAQAAAIERSETRATRKESNNETIRKTHPASQRGESANMRNLRATAAAVGIPDKPPANRGAELVRAKAAEIAAAKRAASERAIRSSADRRGMGGSDGGRSQ